MSKQVWSVDRVEELLRVVDGENPVSYDKVKEAAHVLETSTRSVSSKLRHMGISVESMATIRGKAYTDEESEALRAFVEANSGRYTFAEIAENFANGKFDMRGIQGKLLSMDLISLVKATPKKESVKVYSDEEEVLFKKMASEGAYLEDIAAALNRELNSVRGKALSLYRQEGLAIPKQKNKKEVAMDPLEALGEDIANMTVEDIVDATGKTARGVKTMLTHRGITVADYDGAKRAAKIAEKNAA